MKNILPVLADFANGIFAVFIASYITHMDIVAWHFIVGILLAMCPDLDAIPELYRRGRIAASKSFLHDHRETLHRPLIFILLGTCIIYFQPYWGVLFLVATMLHFVNDMYGTGWGVPLFSPFNKDRYKFFTDGDNKSSLHPKNMIRVFKQQSLTQSIKEHGDDDWILHNYVTPNTVTLVEYALFGIACVLVMLHFI